MVKFIEDGVEEEQKTCFSMHKQKYIEFKNIAARKYKWKRGYTSESLKDALDLFLVFTHVEMNGSRDVAIKIMKKKGMVFPEDKLEMHRMVYQELIDTYIYINQHILGSSKGPFKHPYISRNKLTLINLSELSDKPPLL